MKGSADNRWAKSGDDILRPWTKNDEFQSIIREAEMDLADTITKTSYSRNGGACGSSVLDPVPKELLDLKIILELANGADTTTPIAEDVAVVELNSSQGPAVDESPLTVEAVDTNNEEEESDAFPEYYPMGAPLIPISSVKYKKRLGPAIANISTVQYLKLLKSLKMVSVVYVIVISFIYVCIHYGI